MTRTVLDLLLGAALMLLVLRGKHWLARSRARWHAVSFYVDSGRGADDGPGTKGAPLRTLGELARRVEGRVLRGDLDVSITGNFADEVLRLHCDGSRDSIVTVSGVPFGWGERARQRLTNIWLRWGHWTRNRDIALRERLFRYNQDVGDLDVDVRGGRVVGKNLSIGRKKK